MDCPRCKGTGQVPEPDPDWREKKIAEIIEQVQKYHGLFDFDDGETT